MIAKTIASLSILSLAAAQVFIPAKAAGADSLGYFLRHDFVANKASYGADTVEPEMVNAWGVAIRPAGAGGHFWVVADKTSFEYIGDVRQSPDKKLRTLHTDALKYVTLPVGGEENVATGTIFLDGKDSFVITQPVEGVEPITAPAKFLFASDGGIISAWTERKRPDGEFDRPGEAIAVIDESPQGAQFFGLAVNENYSRIYAADFGAQPGIHVYDNAFKPVKITFDMPFDENWNGKVDAGEYAPFNIQALKTPQGQTHLFVTYAKTMLCPKEEAAQGNCREGMLFAGEEDTTKPGYGKLAEFTEDGKLVAHWEDGGKLSAPWGVAFAPRDYGKYSEALLVANFGDGTIAAYDSKSRNFIDYLRDAGAKPIEIDKIWGLAFGNGQSLGDSDALYFTAGPEDETDGIFGSLRLVTDAK